MGQVVLDLFAQFTMRLYVSKSELVWPVELDKSRPMLLVGNHIGWWDGFWALDLNRRYFHKDFYVMMLEEELEKRLFFRRTGAFSVAPGKRSILKSLNYAVELLASPGNLVVMFPQGRIRSLYDQRFEFGSGVHRILRECETVQLVLMANFVEFGNKPRLSMQTYLRELMPSELGDSIQDLASAYSDFYQECKEFQLKRELN